MFHLTLFGERADAFAKKLEEKGLVKKFSEGNGVIDVKLKYVCTSVEGRPLTELEFDL